MIKSGDYLDRCVEAVGTIDAEQLESIRLGDLVGEGSAFKMHTLGRIGVFGGPVCVGSKMPRGRKTFRVPYRLTSEIRSISLLLSKLPDLLPEVPIFMSLLAVGEKVVGLLTEDASQGNIATVRPLTNNNEIAATIAQAFHGDNTVEVDKKAAANSLSFMVGDRRRLLDLTPPPVRFDPDNVSILVEKTNPILDKIECGALTVSVRPDSPLGQSLSSSLN